VVERKVVEAWMAGPGTAVGSAICPVWGARRDLRRRKGDSKKRKLSHAANHVYRKAPRGMRNWRWRGVRTVNFPKK